MMDPEALLAPVSAADPCGPDLEYDPAFRALEQASRGESERRLGAASRPAQAPDWAQVKSLASNLLRRTKDWRVARMLLQSEVHLGGLTGLATGLQVLLDLAERYGQEMHPVDDSWEWPPTQVLALSMEGEGGILEDVRALPFGVAPDIVSAGEVERAISGEPSFDVTRAAIAKAASTQPGLRTTLDLSLTIASALGSKFMDLWNENPVDGLYRLIECLRNAATQLPTFEVAVPTTILKLLTESARSDDVRPLPHDVDPLLIPLSETEPCGPDLEYDPRSIEMEGAIAGRAERQYGQFVLPAESPDWCRAYALALDLFNETRDLRVAIAMTRAATHLHGLRGTLFGLQLIDRLLASHWEEVHPQLDLSDDDPLWRRRVALAGLGVGGLVDDVRGLASTQNSEVAAGLTRANDAVVLIQRTLAQHLAPEIESVAGLLSALQQLRGAPSPQIGAEANREVTPIPSAIGKETLASSAMARAIEELCAYLDSFSGNLDAICARASRLRARQFAELETHLAGPRLNLAGLDAGSSPGQR